MAAVARRAETMIDYKDQFAFKSRQQVADITEVISQGGCSSLVLNAKAIITATESGFTARMISKYRPKAPIIAVTRMKKCWPRSACSPVSFR